MMRNLCSSFVPIVLLLATSPAFVAAQPNSCVSRVLVTSMNGNIAVAGASATATNNTTLETYRSLLKEDMPYFANLPEGGYRITVAKPGYKKSSRDLYLYCSMANPNFYDWSIELYRGNSRKIVRLADPPVLASSLPATNNPNRIRTINGGVLNWRAASLTTPEYPAMAKASKVNGTVIVKVIVDEHGKVIFASTHSGDPLLRASSETAALATRFSPTLLGGESVRLSGIITYYFAP